MDGTMILVIGMTLGTAFGFMMTYIAMHHDAQSTQQAIYSMYLEEMNRRVSLEVDIKRANESGKTFRNNKVRIIKRIDGEEVV